MFKLLNLNLANNPLKTKADVTAALLEILMPLEKHMATSVYGLKYGSGGAIYNERTREIEALLRPLWGIAPLLAGGGEYLFFGKYTEKMASGTDPVSPAYWGDIGRYDQRMVEMASIALAIMMVPDVWGENLFRWLE